MRARQALLQIPTYLGAILLLNYGITCCVCIAGQEVVRVEKHGVTGLEAVGLPSFVGGIYHPRLGDREGIGQLLGDVAYLTAKAIRERGHPGGLANVIVGKWGFPTTTGESVILVRSPVLVVGGGGLGILGRVYIDGNVSVVVGVQPFS